MKNKIKRYFENLNPKKLGLKKKIKVSSVSKLGMGTGNLNYLVIVNKKKFIFRLNMALNNPTKSKKEFESLKIVEKLNIAPKAWILDESGKDFDQDFIIIDYLEGKTSEKIKPYLNLKLIKAVAKLIAKIHSIRITPKLRKLNKEEYNYKSYLEEIKKRIIYIKQYIKNKSFLEIIDKTYNRSFQKFIEINS